MEDENVIIFKDPLPNGQPNWDRDYARLNPGDYIGNLNSIGYNDSISAIYIHPRLALSVWEHADKGGRGAKFYGSQYQIVDWNLLRQIGFNDNISSLYVEQIMTADDWKKSCCRQENTQYTSQSNCGHYWNQEFGSCGNLGCTGDSLKTDVVCQNWCKKNPVYCDVIKSQFCREHTTDPYCGCINDTPAALAERTKYSKYSSLATVPRKCWPSSPCNTGADLVNSFITTDLNPNTSCPTSLVNQINEINAAANSFVYANQNQNADVTTGVIGGGSGAIDQLNAGYTPANTTQSYSQSSSANFAEEKGGGLMSNPETKKKWLIFLVIFIILIMLGTMGYFFLPKSGGKSNPSFLQSKNEINDINEKKIRIFKN